MRPAKRANLAFLAAGGLVLLLALAVSALSFFASRSLEADPDPNGVAGSAAGAAGDALFVDWGYWLGVNPDIVGWVDVPGTEVSFPVVLAPEDDPDYYLSHDVYGSYNPMGAVYLDSGCDGISSGGNTVIFGHNWAGMVFAPLAGYSDRAWAEEHRTISLLTPDGAARALEVQCADVIPGGEAVKRTDFESREDLMAYWEERFDACRMKIAPEACETDQIYTFVTCSYNFWPSNERTLVYAVEKDCTTKCRADGSAPGIVDAL